MSLRVGALCLVLGIAAGVGVGAAVAGGDDDASPDVSAADVGFSQDMAVHHEQAIEMALLAERKATPELRSLATTIELTQARESGAMRGWLQLWGEPQLPTGAPMAWMPHDGSMDHTSPMLGLASRDELSRLAKKRGTAFDVLFLQLMIRHHQGAVLMARGALDAAATPVVRQFAQQVILGQTEEISVLKGHLVKLGADPLPEPA